MWRRWSAPELPAERLGVATDRRSRSRPRHRRGSRGDRSRKQPSLIATTLPAAPVALPRAVVAAKHGSSLSRVERDHTVGLVIMRLVVSGTDHVYAIDVRRGSILWQHALAQPRAIVRHDDSAIIGGRGGLCSIELATGATRWAHTGGIDTLCLVDDELYAIGPHTRLHSRVARTGAERWSSNEGLGEEWSALYATDWYVLLLSGHATAVQRVDGARISNVGLGEYPQLSAEVRGCGDRLVGTGWELAFALSVDLPECVLWLTRLPEFPRSPRLVDDLLCFAFTSRSDVMALEIATGQPRWTVDLDGPGTDHLAVHGQTLFVIDQRGRLCALNASDGATRWTLQTDCNNARLLVSDAAIYVVGSQTCRVSFAGVLAWIGPLSTPAAAHGLAGDSLLLATQNAVMSVDTETGALAWTLALPDVRVRPSLLA
ncbi:MAG: PQQ-binding-like beta-propeller repeat protein [Kofleriaceae bacterium]